MFESTGDIVDSPLEALGFFYRDTRHLSCFEVSLAGEAPYFLNSYVSDDNTEVRANLTNPDFLGADDAKLLPRDLIQIQRSWVLSDARLFQRIAIRNFAPATVKIELDFALGADFRDMFEVRGQSRKKRGEMHDAKVDRKSLEFSYTGLDRIGRSTLVSFSRQAREPFRSQRDVHAVAQARCAMEMEIGLEARQDRRAPMAKSSCRAISAMRLTAGDAK